MKETSLTQIRLSSGEVLKKGSRVRLGDKVGEKYKQTKQWDISIEDSFLIYIHDSNDFQFIEIYAADNSCCIKAHKLLSLLEDEFQYFKLENGIQFGYTNHLRIEIEKALKSKEIHVVEENEAVISEHEGEVYFLKDVKDVAESYGLGLLSEREKELSLNLKYCYYFQYIQKKWKINYHQGITGSWHKKD